MPTGIYTGPLCVLDLTSFNWYVPAISGDVPKFRAWHKANLIGKYMVVSFGIYKYFLCICNYYLNLFELLVAEIIILKLI